MAEQADARDLKSRGTNIPYRFDPGFRHHCKFLNIAEWSSLVARRAHNPKVAWFKSSLRNQTKHLNRDAFLILSGYKTDERGSLGERAKTIEYRFREALRRKARRARSECIERHGATMRPVRCVASKRKSVLVRERIFVCIIHFSLFIIHYSLTKRIFE